MPELIAALMVWAHALTGLPVPAEMPTVVKTEPCEIQKIHSPGAECVTDDKSMRPVALYLHERGTILLPKDWDANDLGDVSMLLHEIVHHMQHKSGLTIDNVACVGLQLERPAYEVQIAFLEAAGVDPWETMGLNEVMYWFITDCRRRF